MIGTVMKVNLRVKAILFEIHAPAIHTIYAVCTLPWNEKTKVFSFFVLKNTYRF